MDSGIRKKSKKGTVAVPRSGTVGDGEVEVSIKPCTLDKYGFFFGKL